MMASVVIRQSLLVVSFAAALVYSTETAVKSLPESQTFAEEGRAGTDAAVLFMDMLFNDEHSCVRCNCFSERGTPGQTGPMGPPGAAGPAGGKGPSGARGAPGESGKPGDQRSARGAPGSRGPKGFQGPSGRSGPPGRQGQPGGNGMDGPRGPPGVQGKRGAMGIGGEDGKNGCPGAPGKPGPDGRPGSSSGTSMPGPRGDTGAPGCDGNDGLPGPRGPDGEDGRFVQGRTGSQGPPGQKGDPGQNGYPGRKGPNGRPGSMGPSGTRGPRGRMGPPGRDELDKDISSCSAYVYAMHSQRERSPDCPRNHVKIAEGYSLLHLQDEGRVAGENLGAMGSCMPQFDPQPMMFCGANEVCSWGSRTVSSYWLTTDQWGKEHANDIGPIVEKPMGAVQDRRKLMQHISRCSVCMSPGTVMAFHSQSREVPQCPQGNRYGTWVPLWEGYSFLMHAIGAAGVGQQLDSPGSCLRHYSHTPYVECDANRYCHYWADYMMYWLYATETTFPNSTIKRGDVASRVGRCQVCAYQPANAFVCGAEGF